MEKGSTAEGYSQSKLQPWVVAEYAPDCHESGVLSCGIKIFPAMNVAPLMLSFVVVLFYSQFERKQEK